jgi:hypothetical protein
MEVAPRTLVIFLTMHRSGSSLTAGTLGKLGMSLGPFQLLGESPHNAHGHFEAVPFLELNREIQKRVYGFIDDLPESTEHLRKFVDSDGAVDWPEIPEECLSRGRALIEALIDSGEVSGFKDPRTVLLWPFWQRVLSAFPEVRVVPVALLRSPHEIAMSLFARREGECGYWTCLDVVAVHLRRLQLALREWSEPVPRVRFGGPQYFDDLAQAACACGLEWDAMKALRTFDGTCVHQVPAAVNHRAQQLYDELCGAGSCSPHASRNATQLEADGRARDELQLSRLRLARDAAENLTSELRQAREHYNEAAERSAEQSRQALAQFDQAQAELRRVTAEYEAELSRCRQMVQELQFVCAEQREFIERLERHPIIGRALRGRRRLKTAIRSLMLSSAG